MTRSRGAPSTPSDARRPSRRRRAQPGARPRRSRARRRPCGPSRRAGSRGSAPRDRRRGTRDGGDGRPRRAGTPALRCRAGACRRSPPRRAAAGCGRRSRVRRRRGRRAAPARSPRGPTCAGSGGSPLAARSCGSRDANDNQSQLRLTTVPSPADLVDLPFMRTAVLELALLAVAGGLFGAWIVLRRLAFFAHAVGSATFPGLVAADAAGARALPAALAVALAYAAAVQRAGSRAAGRAGDAVTGIVLAAALATGVILASDVFHSGARVDSMLFGSLLGISTADVWAAAAAGAVAVLATLVLGRTWLAAGFDRPGAAALGARRVAVADALLLALVAATVVASLPAVGALLTASLFIVPAATVRLAAPSVPALLAGSVALALAEGVAGAYLALWLDAPPGPVVAVLGGAVFAAAALATAALPRPARAAA